MFLVMPGKISKGKALLRRGVANPALKLLIRESKKMLDIY